MENQNQNTNDLSKPTGDFEMGTSENQAQTPMINKYGNSTHTPENIKKDVDPTAPAPVSTNINQIPSTVKKSNPPNPEARKKAVLGCLGAFSGITIIFLILAMVFIVQSDKDQVSPIARLLGLNQAVFINSLITLVNVVFILLAIITFIFTMVGLFKASMAKKDDREEKKKGLSMSFISGISFMMILIIWGFLYFYLDAKRIPINQPIVTGIITEPAETLNLTAPVDIRFDGSKLPINSQKYQILAYKWNFGDGKTGTKQIETHTYETKGKDGRYEVKLTVSVRDKKTNEEEQMEFSKLITISDEAIHAEITADPMEGEVPLTVNFSAEKSTDPDGEIIIYEWDLDEDGKFDDAEGTTAEKEFKKVGKYLVKLRVTSKDGDYSIAEKEISVKEKVLPDAVISIVNNPQYFVKNVQYVFSAEDSTSPNGKIKSYSWNFGDGKKLTTKTVNYTFTKEGTYQVILTVTDEDGKEGEITKKITVGSPKGSPKAIITSTPTPKENILKGSVPFTVEFDASKTTDSDNNIVDYTWDFDGDGKAEKFGESVSHTFTTTGKFPVTLTVTDADKNSSTSKLTVEVGEQGIKADLKANRLQGTIPLTVTFDASGSTYSSGEIVSYKWDFGDGTVPTLGTSTISHKYTSIGSFTAKVTVIGSDNSSATETILITVREIPLQACFETPFESGKAPVITTFDPGCSSGTIVNYFWEFGDGTTSNQVKPSHTFEKPGNFTVNLEITDDKNNVSNYTKTITVTE